MPDQTSEAELSWTRCGPGEFNRDNQRTIDAVKRLIKAKDRATLTAQLAAWPPENIMDLLVHLPIKHARKVFDWLPAGPSHKVLAELRPEFRAMLMQDATVERLAALLDSMAVDDAADTFAALPDEVQDKVLPRLPAADPIVSAAEYRHDTAGRVMTRRMVALPEDSTVGSAITEIQQNAELIQKLDDVFVVDGERRPVGTFRPKRLLLAPPETKLSEIMARDITTVSADTDQEEVVRIAARQDVRSVPVVDRDGRLVGQVTLKQLRRIVHDESVEDLLRMGSVSAEATSTDSIRRIITGRLPWLLAGLIGATVAALVIGSFEEQLQQAAIVAAFIPVVMSLAGNSGLQASAVTVQALATGTVWTGDVGWRFVRELAGALINGTVAGSILAALILIGSQIFDIEAPVRLAASVSLALLTVTTIAALVGAFVPMALDRIGIDPATATGVFITTSNDILGVLVFFVSATMFYFA